MTSSPALSTVPLNAAPFKVADLFCGAGGTSSGVYDAAAVLRRKVELLAINHWFRAIETHSRNHPDARHMCDDMEKIDPREAIPDGYLDLLVASPECTHHSNARGGKPMSNQSRASAKYIIRWAAALHIKTIIIENVPEFQTWGPLTKKGRPNKRYKGMLFHAFLDNLRLLGYRIEYRVLNAADYGDATTRKRLFIIARRDGKPIRFPEPTHSKDGSNGTQRWRAAREIIDWSIPGQSIFRRKKPLAKSTMDRIAAGLKKFGGANAEPFLVVMRNHADGRSLEDPVPALAANGQHMGLCESFLVKYYGTSEGAYSVDATLGAVTTKDRFGLVKSFLVPFYGTKGKPDGRCHSLDAPAPTLTTENRLGVVTPFLIPYHGENSSQEPRTHSLEDPAPVIACSETLALVSPFVLTIDHTGSQSMPIRSAEDPLSTVTTEQRHAVVTPFYIPTNHGKDDKRAHSVDEAMKSITTVDAWALVQPFLTNFYGNPGEAKSLDETLGTVMTKDKFALVQPVGVDIHFRMLHPRELSRAMSFGDEYEFSGNREAQVKQIGNAVPRRTAKQLCLEVLRSL